MTQNNKKKKNEKELGFIFRVVFHHSLHGRVYEDGSSYRLLQRTTTGGQCHDDVIKWKCVPRYWPFVRGIHRSPVNSPHKGQWRGALMFSLICTWTNDWVNNRDAGDLRRYRAHYDVIVMASPLKACASLGIHGTAWQGNTYRITGSLGGNPLHKGPVMRKFDVSLLLAQMISWTNNRVSSYLRRHSGLVSP